MVVMVDVAVMEEKSLYVLKVLPCSSVLSQDNFNSNPFPVWVDRQALEVFLEQVVLQEPLDWEVFPVLVE